MEEAEEAVLRGGSHLFREVRPLLLCEGHPSNRRAVSHLLRRWDYRLFDLETHPPRPLAQASFETLACPAERLGDHPLLVS